MRRSRALVAILVVLVVSAATGLPTLADLNLILGASAQVSYTNGDGVNVRDDIGFGGNVITALGEGVEVIVHDGPVAANDGSYWYYISSSGYEGWVIADYLSLPGSQSSTDTTGDIAYTGGDGVNVHSSASLDAGLVTTLFEGTTVAILDGPQWDAAGNAWTLVSYQGVQGWVLDDYIAWYGSGGDSGIAVQQVDDSWTAYVVNTDGGGLRLRDSASYDATSLVVMDPGSAVTVYATGIIGADGTDWWNVEYEGIVGYAAGYYLGESAETQQAAAEPADQTSADATIEDLGVYVGSWAEVTGTSGEGLNMRYEWGYDSGIVATLPSGSVVWVVDGPVWGDDGTPWFQVDSDGTTGWVHGGFLVYTESAPETVAEVSAAASEPDAAPVNTFGNSVVTEAMKYVGLPYVWGGTTTAGFDCSGFVHYVMTQVLGYTFSRSLEVQATSGVHVDIANLQPGDLVFFQNTYTWGLSHDGIYIGDGQFVHAGSERTGVTISNISDSYWSSRFYTARRVGS